MPIARLSPSRSLNLLLDNPNLAGRIQSMSAPDLAALVREVGLEDAGEMLSLATSEQLRDLIDEDVWRTDAAGEDASFDPERFLLWLEILLEAGETALVSRLSELPEDLVIMAFHEYVLVLNLDDLAVEMADLAADVNLTEKALESALGIEIGPYFAIARRHDGWDTLTAAIISLDSHAPDLLEKILSRCCYASWEHISENGGLYDVLTAEEMLISDAAADRADRRAAEGYVAPSDAAAFLKLALKTPIEALLHCDTPDPITLAYQREWIGARPRQRRRTATSAPAANAPREPLDTALSALARLSDDAVANNAQALLYLANVVISGLGTTENPIRPADALRAAMDICAVGLELVTGEGPPPASGTDPLQGTSIENLFMAGWKTLSRGNGFQSLAAARRALDERRAHRG